MLSKLFLSSVTSCRSASRSFAIASRRALVSDGGGGEGERPCCDRDRDSPRATAEEMECDVAPFACAVVGESGGSSSTSPSCDGTAGFYVLLAVCLLIAPADPAERSGAVRIVRLPRQDRRRAPLACGVSHSQLRLPLFCSHLPRLSSCSSSFWTSRRPLQFGQSKLVLTSSISPD
jgi:hypothetical protein